MTPVIPISVPAACALFIFIARHPVSVCSYYRRVAVEAIGVNTASAVGKCLQQNVAKSC
ncbi:hypothetical protein [Acinetobacter sp. YH01020]|uniref:hypothetical protein n=1 Tax=Acinetobacter sp. YH01020 TaxID=2601034 RepID=UPI001C555822|nr:hypothetical protein [Acinetobacter sp. YH01020]